jgi:hypothetical protein
VVKHVSPFTLESEDIDSDVKRKKVVATKRKQPRFQALNDDMIWIAEQDISRTKKALLERDAPLTDREHSRFIKTAEQLRKLRLTDSELNKMHDPASMATDDLDDEFDERCEALGLDPRLVERAIGL